MAPGNRRHAEVIERELLGQTLVVVMNPEEGEDQHRHQQHDDPGPIAKLGHRKDNHDDEGADGPDGVDDSASSATALIAQGGAGVFDLLARLQMADAPPAAGHAGLGQGEGEEDTDGVERDQAVTLALKGRSAPSDQGQGHDAVRKDQPAAFVHQLFGQEAVAGVSAPRRGKSANEVLAAMIRIRVVDAIVAR